MRAYIGRRLLLFIPTVFLVTLMVFALIQLVPGSVIENMLGELQYHYTETDVAKMKEQMGIDVPIYVQYGRWVGGLFRGSLGESLYTGVPVRELVAENLPISIELGVLALLVSLTIALPIGIYSAVRQDTWGDYVARSFSILLITLPSFWIGTMVMVYPSVWWNWTPPLTYVAITEDLPQNLLQFIIPAAILGMYLSGTIMRMTRTMMLEVLRQDYIRTAWAKGLGERVVVVKHALKNALIPVVTMMGLMAPVLVGGAVVLEQIFNLPGMGRLFLNAMNNRDYTVIAGVNLVVCVFVIVANLIVDLSYGFLDPRIRYN